MPKAPKKKAVLDLGLVPGTKREQQAQARALLARRVMPIEIVKDGSKYRLDVLGTPIGSVDTRQDACSAAFFVGRYRLELGDFAYAYIGGWEQYGCGD